jgi:hypothetical protein
MKKIKKSQIAIDFEDDDTEPVTVGVCDFIDGRYYVGFGGNELELTADQWLFVFSALEGVISDAEPVPVPKTRKKK